MKQTFEIESLGDIKLSSVVVEMILGKHFAVAVKEITRCVQVVSGSKEARDKAKHT